MQPGACWHTAQHVHSKRVSLAAYARQKAGRHAEPTRHASAQYGLHTECVAFQPGRLSVAKFGR
eukprot:2685043-Pyramimonas_sp.AAC.1